MAKVFISYDRASKDIVEQLVEDLRDDDHEIWFDQHLTGGQDWWDNILSAIRECEIFVAALTPEFLESKACQRELKYATDLQRILLPVRLSTKLSADSLPSHLSRRQWEDYSVRSVEAFRSLQRALRNLPKASPLPDPLPDAPPAPISFTSQLREKIHSESLARQDQIQLVFELRQQFRKGESVDEIIDLLQRLRKREDILAVVWQDIGDLLREIDGGRSGGEVKPPAPPTAVSREDQPRADRRIKVGASFTHGAPDGWFKPGAGKSEWFKDHELGPEMVVVPSGEFTMGTSASEIAALNKEYRQGWYDWEGPQHLVRIKAPFAVGRFAVHFDEWDSCIAEGGCDGYRPDDEGWGRGKRPVINVSFDDAVAYVEWLSRKTGKTYRLLSEAGPAR